jgi:hypothetical protein
MVIVLVTIMTMVVMIMMVMAMVMLVMVMVMVIVMVMMIMSPAEAKYRCTCDTYGGSELRGGGGEGRWKCCEMLYAATSLHNAITGIVVLCCRGTSRDGAMRRGAI